MEIPWDTLPVRVSQGSFTRKDPAGNTPEVMCPSGPITADATVPLPSDSAMQYDVLYGSGLPSFSQEKSFDWLIEYSLQLRCPVPLPSNVAVHA